MVASNPVRIIREAMPIVSSLVEAVCNLIALTYLSISFPGVRMTLLILAPCHLGFSAIKLYRIISSY